MIVSFILFLFKKKGWSWLGNGKGDCNTDLSPLNIAKGKNIISKVLNILKVRTIKFNKTKGDATNSWYWKQNDYTKWGNDLIYYTEFGIKDSSVKASIFA